MPLLEQGRTRIHTRREKARIIAAVIVAFGAGLAGFVGGLVVAAWWIGGPVAVHRQPMTDGTGLLQGGDIRPPLYLVYPEPALTVGALTALACCVGTVTLSSRWANRRPDPRDRHLARPGQIRREYSSRAARKAGAFTLPDTTRRERTWLPTTAFGVLLGKVRNPRKGGAVWISPEYFTRIIARTGWGKTFRLLIPMIRGWVGPAVISSVEPDIFLSTVRARQYRWPGGRRRILPRKVRSFNGDRWERPAREEYPVWVVECMPAANKVAHGYPEVRIDPIVGCERYATALRRARALVKGLDSDGEDNQSGGTARWFEGVCAEVIAAWLHALAFWPTGTIADMDKWLRTKDIATPRRILENHPDANPAAATHLVKHLAKEGGRTTANVETFLARALTSMTGEEGRALVAPRGARDVFDPTDLILDKGTLYLLAEDEQMATVRPLLSLIASEVARAGEQVARSRTDGPARLPEALGLFLDELRRGIRIAELPRIRQTSRKFGITCIYACTNGGDEAALYGEHDAAALKAGAVSVYAGYDEATAPDVEKASGNRPVVTSTWSKHGRSEHEEMRPVLDAADMQRLPAGDAVVVAPGMAPFIVHCPSVYEQRGLRRQITREKQELRRG